MQSCYKAQCHVYTNALRRNRVPLWFPKLWKWSRIFSCACKQSVSTQCNYLHNLSAAIQKVAVLPIHFCMRQVMWGIPSEWLHRHTFGVRNDTWKRKDNQLVEIHQHIISKRVNMAWCMSFLSHFVFANTPFAFRVILGNPRLEIKMYWWTQALETGLLWITQLLNRLEFSYPDTSDTLWSTTPISEHRHKITCLALKLEVPLGQKTISYFFMDFETVLSKVLSPSVKEEKQQQQHLFI